MALGGVYMQDIDGAIGFEKTNVTEKISGLLFDISGQPDFWTKGPAAQMADKLKDSVVEINSLDDAIALGIAKYTGESEEGGTSKDFLYGIPYYHIRHYFQLNGGTGRLFIAFADCSANWEALNYMQRASGGIINQFGIWTEQSLWRVTDAAAEKYAIDIVDDVQLLANGMANEDHAPAVFILNANTAKVKTATGTNTQVTFSMIPSCKTKEARYVAVALSQGIDTDVKAMQMALGSKTPVGNIGAILGILSTSNVAESIGFVNTHNVGNYFPDIEMGFGDCEVADGALKNTMRYAAMTQKQVDTLHDNGYIFLCKYAGLEGNCYFNGDSTCSNGDYRTLSRNRVINKSRRGVRQALLPYVNCPLKLDPATGQLSAAQTTVFKNLVEDVLNMMTTAEEISGVGAVVIPPNQNVLQNDKLILKYTLIPMGTAQTIDVTEGFAVSK